MDPLLTELAAIVDAAERAGVRLAVIGACALRTYLPRPELRRTVDLDLLVASGGRSALASILESRGFRLYSTGPWLRAERPEGTPRIVDIAFDAIVDLASFQAYPLDPARAVRRCEPGGPELPVPLLEDLVAQKLIAAREKDLLDVLLVAVDASIDGARLARNVEDRDVEIAVRRGALELVAAARSGRLAQLWSERTGEPLAADALARALAAIQAWLGLPA
jgi:hypothetical protein